MNIPEGYKLVPVKANCDQLHAGASKSGVLVIYEAMVEAAPAVEFNAYDEAKERELFEAFAMEHFLPITHGHSRDYLYHDTESAWSSWKACAKSRARSAE